MNKRYLEEKAADNCIKSLPGNRILLVRGNRSYRECGAEKWLNSLLDGRKIKEFHGFKINPELPDLEKGLGLFRKYRPDSMMAVGGGSVLDMAKLIRFFGCHDLNPSEWLDGQSWAPSTIENCPLVAVPTTAGTGAEATHFAVLYRNGVKHSVEHPSLYPDDAILKPELTYAMDCKLCATTGMDAYAQAVEGWWSKKSTGESRRCSEEALARILPSFIESCRGNKDGRRAMLIGAYWAGRSIDIAKTTAPHAFSYILTSHFNLPHGLAVSIVLPYFMAYNFSRMNPKDAGTLRKLLGIQEGEEQRWTEALIRSVKLDIKLNVAPDVLKNLFRDNVNRERLKNNPVDMEANTCIQLAQFCSSYGQSGREDGQFNY